MSIFLWFCVIWWSLNAIVAVALVGKERKPFTPGQAVFNTIFYGALIAWAVSQA